MNDSQHLCGHAFHGSGSVAEALPGNRGRGLYPDGWRFMTYIKIEPGYRVYVVEALQFGTIGGRLSA